jgi:hypothetical protein
MTTPLYEQLAAMGREAASAGAFDAPMTRPPLPRPGSLGLIQYAGTDMHAYADACTGALQERVKVLEQDGPTMQRGTSGDGTTWMGTMRECLQDAQDAAVTEARLGDEARARVKVLERLVTDAAYTLGKARVWNGMGWTYNPLHPAHYTQMYERLRNACDGIYGGRAAPKDAP